MGVADRLLADGERSLVVLRPHVRRVFRPALILLLLAPAAAFAAAVVPPGVARGPVRLFVISLALFAALRWVLWPFLRWWNTVYVLTDERFFERRGVVRRIGHDLPLQGVTDVVVAQSLGERLLRCGTLRVVTEGGGEIVLTDVPAISRVQRSLLAVTEDISQRLRSSRRRVDDIDIDIEIDEIDGPHARVEDDLDGWMRRTPVRDSPLEDGGEDGGDEVPTRPLDGQLDGTHDHDEASQENGGAQILRFPPRP